MHRSAAAPYLDYGLPVIELLTIRSVDPPMIRYRRQSVLLETFSGGVGLRKSEAFDGFLAHRGDDTAMQSHLFMFLVLQVGVSFGLRCP